MAEERSLDSSSSAESQPKFPGCSHFRRRNDNHFRCQQCRLNEGQSLCIQDSPCLVCKDWLPEAWVAQAKANTQRNRRKAAAAAKAAKKAEETMDNTVEIHAPEEAIQLPSKRSTSEGSSKTKRTKTKATTSKESSQPKSVVSSVSVVGRTSSHGSDRRRSRSPERKPQARGRQTSGFSETSLVTAWRLPARERAVLAKFLWRFQLPEACRVWQCLQGVGHPSVGLFLSTSSSFFGWSSIPVIKFISGISRPQVSAQSREKMRECRPDGSDVRHQTGCQAVPQAFQAAWEENDHDGLFAGPAGSCWISPRSSSPGTGGGRPGRCRPGSRQRLGHRWWPCNTQRHGCRQQHGHRWRFGYRWRPSHRGRAGHSGRPSQWRPSRCLRSWVRATLWWTGWDGRPSTPSSRSTTWNPGSYIARGWTRRLQVYRDQQLAFPFHPEIHQSRNAGRLHVNVDVTAASEGPVQCSSGSSLSSRPGSSSGSQTWLNQQEISHAG